MLDGPRKPGTPEESPLPYRRAGRFRIRFFSLFAPFPRILKNHSLGVEVLATLLFKEHVTVGVAVETTDIRLGEGQSPHP